MSSADEAWQTLNQRFHAKYGFAGSETPFQPSCPYEQVDLEALRHFLQRPDTENYAVLAETWLSRFVTAFPVLEDAAPPSKQAPKSFTQALIKEMLLSSLVYPSGPPTVTSMRVLATNYKCTHDEETKLKLYFASKGETYVNLLEALLKKGKVTHVEKPIQAYFLNHSRNDAEMIVNLGVRRAATEDLKQRKVQAALLAQTLLEECQVALDLRKSNEDTTMTQIADIEDYINSLEKPSGLEKRAPHTAPLEEAGKNLFREALQLFTLHSSSIVESVSAEIHNAHHEAIISLTDILHYMNEVQVFLKSGNSTMAFPTGDALTTGGAAVAKRNPGGQKGKRLSSDPQTDGFHKRQLKGNIYQKTVS